MREAKLTAESQLKKFFGILSYLIQDINLLFLGSYFILRGHFLKLMNAKWVTSFTLRWVFYGRSELQATQHVLL